MRKRFRRNAPVGTSHQFGASQLYAGKSMYPDTPVAGGGEDAEGGTKKGGENV